MGRQVATCFEARFGVSLGGSGVSIVSSLLGKLDRDPPNQDASWRVYSPPG